MENEYLKRNNFYFYTKLMTINLLDNNRSNKKKKKKY